MPVEIVFWWVEGNRHDVHDVSRATSTSYVMKISDSVIQQKTYKQYLQQFANTNIKEKFWKYWKLIKCGEQLSWDSQMDSRDGKIYMMAPIGHWSSRNSIDVNPLCLFKEKTWKSIL